MKTDWTKLAFPRICGLLAVRPSRLSETMHNAAFRAEGLPFHYSAIDVQDTGSALQAMRTLGIRGFSLTVPHKERAIESLDSLSADAQEIGAVNTVVNDGSKLHGFNTDWSGIVEAFQEASCDLQGRTALIFGAGGAARAVIYALRHMQVGNIVVCNRTFSRAEALAHEFQLKACPCESLSSWDWKQTGLFVNASVLGSPLASESDDFPFDFSVFDSRHVVFDLVTRETVLLKKARQQGAATIFGTRMLLFQAMQQFLLFTERDAPKAAMEKALNEELCRL